MIGATDYRRTDTKLNRRLYLHFEYCNSGWIFPTSKLVISNINWPFGIITPETVLFPVLLCIYLIASRPSSYATKAVLPFWKIQRSFFRGHSWYITRSRVCIYTHTPGGTKELFYNPARRLELLSNAATFWM